MERQIKKSMWQMTAIVGTIAALGAWQHEFILHGIEHNPVVNLAILTTMIGSIVLVYYKVAQLYREQDALTALQQTWAEAQPNPKAESEDKFWRYRRCMTPGQLVKTPKIFGQVLEIILDELYRNGRLSVGLDSLQIYVTKVEEKIIEERSVLTYLAGLLVFLGLLGTFIGLLMMVGSIGGILAGLQGSGAGGTEGFTKLLGELQGPIQGMASGFSASLFGLFGSLTVGLLERIYMGAAGNLKHRFETWLAAVAEADAKQVEEAARTGASDVILPTVGRAAPVEQTKLYRVIDENRDALNSIVDFARGGQTAITSLLEQYIDEQRQFRINFQSMPGLAGALSSSIASIRAAMMEATDRTEAATNAMVAAVAELRQVAARTAADQAAQHAELVMVLSHGFEQSTMRADALRQTIETRHDELIRSMVDNSTVTKLSATINEQTRTLVDTMNGQQRATIDIFKGVAAKQDLLDEVVRTSVEMVTADNQRRSQAFDQIKYAGEMSHDLLEKISNMTHVTALRHRENIELTSMSAEALTQASHALQDLAQRAAQQPDVADLPVAIERAFEKSFGALADALEATQQSVAVEISEPESNLRTEDSEPKSPKSLKAATAEFHKALSRSAG
jgi:hypothetical protein